MIRTLNVAERDVFTDPPNVIPVPANTATVILPNEQYINTGEIAYRYLQNVGSNPAFYSVGVTDNSNPPKGVCDGVGVYNGVIYAGQQLDVSNHRLIVTVYSVAGTTFATTIIRRRDVTK